ncbi:hypothetical protein NW754_016612 [Fusarium falciforme]|nr:hypothetical protein NW754_016612 [Fusarium falciforme]
MASISNNVVAASSVSATSTASSSAAKNTTSSSKNAAPGMVANPVSSKYGIIMAAFAAVSFVLGTGI